MSSAQSSPSDTREQIIRTARELLMTRSFLGFSFQDIADRIGIRKPSLYHHFPTKDALGVAIIERTRQTFERWVGRMQLPAAKKLDAYVHMYRDTLGAGKVVCPSGAMVPGWDVIDDGVKREVKAMRKAQVDWLTEVFVELGDRTPRARARAGHLFALCQGALASARITGDVSDFDEAIATARRGAAL